MSFSNADLEREDEFFKKLHTVLSPSQPLQSQEFLKGRDKQISELKAALRQPGRHALIHGLRGVGKSSLAQTVAFATANGGDPVIVSCEATATFGSIIREIYLSGSQTSPDTLHSTKKSNFKAGPALLNIGSEEGISSGPVSEPSSVAEATRFLKSMVDKWGSQTIVIDELDLLSNEAEQGKFADLMKQVSDQHVDVKIIFCGIGESAQALLNAHASVDRVLHTTELGRLPHEARWEIVETAAKELGIQVDRDTTLRIGQISDGFPYYIHLICEKLFGIIFYNSSDMSSTSALFGDAMIAASNSMEAKLKSTYDKAVQTYTSDNAQILWALANGHEFIKRSAAVFDEYVEIMRELGQTPIDRKTFNARMNQLKKEARGAILKGNRSGWYEFSEKMIRGYVRLRAVIEGVPLAPDHPSP